MFKNLKYNQSEMPAENVLGSSYEDMLDKEALLGSKSELKMQDPNEMVSLSHEIYFIVNLFNSIFSKDYFSGRKHTSRPEITEQLLP